MSYSNFGRLLSVFFASALLQLFSLNAHNLHRLQTEHDPRPLGVETQTPAFSWQTLEPEGDFSSSFYRIQVASSKEKLLQGTADMWDSGKTSDDGTPQKRYKGKKLSSARAYYWRVMTWDAQGRTSPWSQPACFETGLLDEKDWDGALWIGMEEDRTDEVITKGLHGLANIDKVLGGKKTGLYALPQLRRELTVRKGLVRARAYVSGLGHFRMYVNGQDAAPGHFLDPGWTKYDQVALYVPLDVTALLSEGRNCLGVMLGNGFFNIPRERYLKLLASYGAPRLRMRLILEYEDGTTDTLVSDPSWKVHESPVTYSSIYGGEDYDANLLLDGWMRPGFDDAAWKQAIPLAFKTAMRSQKAEPLTFYQEIPAQKVFQNETGNWVWDLGQNFSGIVRIRLRSSSDRPVRLIPAELIKADSTANQDASGKPFYLTYTPRAGGEVQEWQPMFTYYGFRYVEVEGAVPAGYRNFFDDAEILELTGIHTTLDAPRAGTFWTSNENMMRIYNLIDWAERSNMASVLTDCPHREKLGWLEEAHLMQYSLQYGYDLTRLYPKIMMDMASTQAPDGMIATTAPELVEFEGGFKDTPEWGAAFIVCPWYYYEFYGDDSLIRDYYDAMKRYLGYLTSKASGHILSYGLGDWFDIGEGNPGESQLTTNGVTATAFYYYEVTLMEKMARLLGKKKDAEAFRSLSEKICKAFNDTFWKEREQVYDRDSQTANAVAVYMGLATGERRRKALENLLGDIRRRNYSLTAGDVGYRYVLRVLEEASLNDVILRMNATADQPGYLWQVARGATALTESWQALESVSNNHLMLGHLMEWFYSGLTGLGQMPGSVGFRHLRAEPSLLDGIRDAACSLETPLGRASLSWRKVQEGVEVLLTVPVGATCTVFLPSLDLDKMIHNGVCLGLMAEKSNFVQSNGKTLVRLQGGAHVFLIEN